MFREHLDEGVVPVVVERRVEDADAAVGVDEGPEEVEGLAVEAVEPEQVDGRRGVPSFVERGPLRAVQRPNPPVGTIGAVRAGRTVRAGRGGRPGRPDRGTSGSSVGAFASNAGVRAAKPSVPRRLRRTLHRREGGLEVILFHGEHVRTKGVRLYHPPSSSRFYHSPVVRTSRRIEDVDAIEPWRVHLCCSYQECPRTSIGAIERRLFYYTPSYIADSEARREGA